MKFLLLFVTILLINCSNPTKRTINNEDGRYTINISPGWDYQLSGIETRVIQDENKSTGNGQVFITIYESEYSNLDDSFMHYTEHLSERFDNYQSVSQGDTQISGLLTKWHRMKDTANGSRYETLQYILQPSGQSLVVINCSARVGQDLKSLLSD